VSRQVLNSGELERMKSVLLLTDGMPNIVPPRGHLAMLQQYKEETGLECTVSTFGFGYSLNSTLLKELAHEVS
jgi:Mg-chelatase subunit ChlD